MFGFEQALLEDDLADKNKHWTRLSFRSLHTEHLLSMIPSSRSVLFETPRFQHPIPEVGVFPTFGWYVRVFHMSDFFRYSLTEVSGRYLSCHRYRFAQSGCSVSAESWNLNFVLPVKSNHHMFSA